MVAFVFGNQQETRRQVEQFGEMTFFFGDQQRTWRKVDQLKNFCPPKNDVLVAALLMSQYRFPISPASNCNSLSSIIVFQFRRDSDIYHPLFTSFDFYRYFNQKPGADDLTKLIGSKSRFVYWKPEQCGNTKGKNQSLTFMILQKLRLSNII